MGTPLLSLFPRTRNCSLCTWSVSNLQKDRQEKACLSGHRLRILALIGELGSLMDVGELLERNFGDSAEWVEKSVLKVAV